MKKILLLLLLLPYFLVAQTSTGQEQEFDYGIKNNASQTVTTADYLTTTGTDGTQGKILPANLPVSTAQQTAIDAKVADFINDNATTIAPSQNAVYDALQLKQTVFTGISQSQFLTENDIVIDNTARTLTIATVKNGEAISGSNPVEFFTDGNGVSLKHTKTSPVVFSFTDTTGVWYFYFNSSGTAIASQTAPTDPSTIAMVYRIYWNAALATADKRVIESIEVYKNDGSWIDREWKNTQGAQYASGLNISSNVIASGTPAVDGSNAVINLSSGTIIDNNFSYTLTNAASGTTKFTQYLGSGLLPATSGKFITITNNASLVLDKIAATDFPFLWNSGTNTPEYLTQLGVRTAVTNNYFFVYYVYALQDPRRGETIKIKSAEIDFANATLAEAHTWAQLQNLFPTLRDSKIRLLYKLTFEYKSAYDVGTKKSALRKIDDLRKQRITTSATVGGTVPASIVTFSPAGNIASTNVQLAIEELDTEKSSTLQDGYLKSATPQITTTATLGSVDIQRGSSADTDKVFRVLNGAGSETSSVAGNGNITGGTYNGYVPANDSNVIHTTGDESFTGLKTTTNSTSPASNGVKFINNYNGGTSTNMNAPIQVENNLFGVGFGGTNYGTGLLQSFSNISTGTLLDFDSDSGSTGDLMHTRKNTILTGKIDHLGNITAPSFIKSGGLSTEYLKADGSVSTLTNPVTGTGTTNYLPKWTGTGTQGNSAVQEVSGRIIVDGTDNGIDKLQVNGSGSFQNRLSVGSTQTVEIAYFEKPSGNVVIDYKNNNGAFSSGILSGGNFSISESNIAERLSIVKTTGVVKINNLSGTGTRTVVADASGNLSATDAVPTSGNFTPTVTDGSGSSGATLVRASYQKVGNIVTAYYSVNTTSTSSTAFITVNVTLPVNRTNSTTLDIGIGSVYVNTGGGTNFAVTGQSIATNSVNLIFKPTAAVSCNLTASIQYSVLE